MPPPPQSPLERAQAAKNRGNKYFKGGQYETAIQCYTEAIGLCPNEQKADLSTFYQNRAAAFEQQVGWSLVVSVRLPDASEAFDLTRLCPHAILGVAPPPPPTQN